MTVVLKASSTFDHSLGNLVCGPDSFGRFYLLGNLNDTVGPWKTERYDPAANAWSTLADVNSGGQSQYYGAWHVDASDRIIYATGYTTTGAGTFQGTNRGYLYDPSSATWSAITSMPAGKGRWEPHFWSQGGLLYLAGGHVGPSGASQDGAPNGTSWTDTWRYSGGTAGTWTDLAAPMNYAHIRPRTGYKSPVDSLGRVYAIGLYSGTSTTPIVGCERWDPATSTWNTIASLPAGKAQYAWAVAPNDDIYVAQGFDGTNTIVKTHYRYNSALNTWSTLAPHPNFGIDAVGFFANGFFFVVGGRAGIAKTIYAYNPLTDTWCPTPDLLQASQPYEMTPIADGTGSFYLPEVYSALTPSGPTRVLDYYSPNTPDPCGAAAHGRSWAQIIG